MSNQPRALEVAEQLKERYGATVPTSQAAALLRSQHALIGELVEALGEAAQSLETLARNACKLYDSDGYENLLEEGDQVRGYAASRASVAFAALSKAKEQQ